MQFKTELFTLLKFDEIDQEPSNINTDNLLANFWNAN